MCFNKFCTRRAQKLIASIHIAGDTFRTAFKGRAILLAVLSIGILFYLVLSGLEIDTFSESITAYKEISKTTEVQQQHAAYVSYFVYYTILAFGIIAGSGAAPRLLTPGRVESMLALPISRAELILGTYLGVLSLTFLAGIIMAIGTALLFWWKIGILPWLPLLGVISAMVSFTAIYAVMLLTACLIRSAPLSIGVGFFFWTLSGFASLSKRLRAENLDAAGYGNLWDVLYALVPSLDRVASFAEAMSIKPELMPDVYQAAGGTLMFTIVVLALTLIIFRARDY